MSVISSSAISRESHYAGVSHPWRLHVPKDVAVSSYFRWKGIVDRLAGLVLMIVGVPIIGLLLAIVRLTSPGPGIYRQTRVGKNGRSFTMYKIRTMRHDAEVGTGATWTHTRDARITRVGRILRKLHLDELPQLLNVVRGEMALIGPRPERPEFVHVLASAVPGYLNRLAVVPGITGLAQLNLPPDSDLASVRRKLVLDVEYVQCASLWLDIRLFLCTFARVVKFPERLLLCLLRLRRSVTLSTAHASLAGGNGVCHTVLTPGGISGQTHCIHGGYESLSLPSPAANDATADNGLSAAESRRKPR
jgi:lipopolysaccharide/colanic/teichoic acid biosynthesis glycosyltransferase